MINAGPVRHIITAFLFASALATAATAAQEGTVAVTTSISNTRVIRDAQTVRLWINIVNNSPRDVSGLALTALYPAHVQVQAVSWNCANRTAPIDVAGCPIVPDALPMGASTSVWVDVKIGSPNRMEPKSLPEWSRSALGDEFTPGAVLTWMDGQRTSTYALSFGAIRTMTPWGYAVESALGWTRDLALPVLLGLIGYLAQRYFMRLTRVGETWNLMLPESHKHVMGTYIGISKWCSIIPSRVEKVRVGQKAATPGAPLQLDTSVDLREALFAVVMVERWWRHMSQVPGGLYLKNRAGEELVLHCAGKYDEYSLVSWCARTGAVRDASELMSTILDYISRHESPARFWRKVDAEAPPPFRRRPGQSNIPSAFGEAVRSLGEQLPAWAASTDAESAMTWITLTSTILNYEVNRPYETWYGGREWLELPPSLTKVLMDDEKVKLMVGEYLRDYRRPLWRVPLSAARRRYAVFSAKVRNAVTSKSQSA
jgi:hypothetical protein